MYPCQCNISFTFVIAQLIYDDKLTSIRVQKIFDRLSSCKDLYRLTLMSWKLNIGRSGESSVKNIPRYEYYYMMKLVLLSYKWIPRWVNLRTSVRQEPVIHSWSLLLVRLQLGMFRSQPQTRWQQWMSSQI